MESNGDKVKTFTYEAMGVKAVKARKMTLGEVMFLLTMICEEAMEMIAATNDWTNATNPLDLLIECAKNAKSPVLSESFDDVSVISGQADAMVDMMYFCYNAAAKVGMNLDEIFEIVHNANMKKRWEDGTFHRGPNGKIEKPPGWQAPDVEEVTKKWLQ